MMTNGGNHSHGVAVSCQQVVPPKRQTKVPILKMFTLSEFQAATKNFKQEMCLGEGGYGKVFKVWFDSVTFVPRKDVSANFINFVLLSGHLEARWLVNAPGYLFAATYFGGVTNINKTVEPHTYLQASKNPRWVEAMHKEIQALESNCTWAITTLPIGKTPIGSKWVYRVKFKADGSVERFKRKYALDHLQCANMMNYKPSTILLDPIKTLNQADEVLLDDPSLYRKLVGKLIYLTITRPDISFAAQALSQLSRQPRITNMAALYKGVLYTSLPTMIVIGKLVPYQERSASGYAVFLSPCLISRTSKKQSMVSRASTKAEYIALADCACEITWLQCLFKDLQVDLPSPVTVLCDNASTIALASYPSCQDQTHRNRLSFIAGIGYVLTSKIERVNERIQHLKKEKQVTHQPQVADNTPLTEDYEIMDPDELDYLLNKIMEQPLTPIHADFGTPWPHDLPSPMQPTSATFASINDMNCHLNIPSVMSRQVMIGRDAFQGSTYNSNLQGTSIHQ
ncbi:putative mitochondrial protein [Tanacetum coccineum]